MSEAPFPPSFFVCDGKAMFKVLNLVRNRVLNSYRMWSMSMSA
jgi:hypothetical protein